MPHKQQNNTAKLRTNSWSTSRTDQIGSNRKQIVHRFVLRSHENICFIQKLNTVTVCYNFFSRIGELKHDYKEKGSSTTVLVERLDNNTCAALAKQQTPFSKIKSPASPKHRKEKVKEEWRKGKEEERREGNKWERRQWGKMFQHVPCPHYSFFYSVRWYLEIMCLVLYSLISGCL